MIDSILSNLQGIVVFAIFLGILISVHEWGHFITAKKCGVQVDEFAIGFGPTLFSKFYNGTTYFLKALPLGGYVKMAGDERDKCTGDPKEFFSQSVGKRALIVLNGPVVNFILAYVCLVLVFNLGFPEASTRVGELVEDYPAQEAGLLVDDQVREVNGASVETWSEMQEAIAQSQGSSINITVLRNEALLEFAIEPNIEEMKNIFGENVERRIVGIVPSEDIITVKSGFFESFVLAGEKFWHFTTMTYKAIYSMIVGSMSAKKSVGGPVFIFTIVKNAAELGFNHFIFILGVISLNLAIFNLLPVIPLDGGHLFLFGIEKLRGKPLPPKVDTWVSNFGLSLILLLTLFIFYVDFERIGVFEKIRSVFS